MRTDRYAIADIAGQQTILEPGKKVTVPQLNLEPGSPYPVTKILYLHLGDDIQVGTPLIPNTTIETTVVEHQRADKVIIFKKKRRKGYRLKKGHRQPFTVLQVGSFGPAQDTTATTVQETPAEPPQTQEQ